MTFRYKDTLSPISCKNKLIAVSFTTHNINKCGWVTDIYQFTLGKILYID